MDLTNNKEDSVRKVREPQKPKHFYKGKKKAMLKEFHNDIVAYFKKRAAAQQEAAYR